MSRNYEMTVALEIGLDPTRRSEVRAAAMKEWPFDTWWGGGKQVHNINASGTSALGGGESEEEFADRLAKAIWEANGRYCEVTVHATDLDELPYETHIRTEDEYEELMGVTA